MPSHRCRRFTLGDAMVLIAATACGFALLRGFDTYQRRSQADWTLGGMQLLVTIPYARRILGLQAPMWLTPWTLAALLLRLRSPRPCLRRVMRQPGALASMLAAVACATSLVMIGKQAAILPLRSPWPVLVPLFELCGQLAGILIAGGWLTLALGRAGRRDPGWIDALGTSLGACWLGIVGIRLAIL